MHDRASLVLLAGLDASVAQITALLARPDAEPLLAVRCPTLVAVGQEDAWSPPAQHEVIAAAMSGACLAIVDGAGHMLPAEAPAALNAFVADWFRTPTDC